MGLIKGIRESWVNRGNKVKMHGTVSESYDDLTLSEILQVLQGIREVAADRATRLLQYEEMLKDGITLSAAELIAEDATQQDPETGKTVWVSCPSNPEWEEKMNKFLQEDVDIEAKIFPLVFNIIVYGDCYLNTFYSDEEYKKGV